MSINPVSPTIPRIELADSESSGQTHSLCNNLRSCCAKIVTGFVPKVYALLKSLAEFTMKIISKIGLYFGCARWAEDAKSNLSAPVYQEPDERLDETYDKKSSGSFSPSQGLISLGKEKWIEKPSVPFILASGDGPKYTIGKPNPEIELDGSQPGSPKDTSFETVDLNQD